MAKGKEMKISITPLADRVLVRRIEEVQKKTASGLIMPDTIQKKESKIGTIIAIGPGRFNDEGGLIPMTVKVGQKVIFNAGWDNEVSLGDDEDYFIVQESDIRAIIK